MDQIKKNITFLDLNVGLYGKKLTTDLHTKSTDKHQCLHYTSAHPAHSKTFHYLQPDIKDGQELFL